MLKSMKLQNLSDIKRLNCPSNVRTRRRLSQMKVEFQLNSDDTRTVGTGGARAGGAIAPPPHTHLQFLDGSKNIFLIKDLLLTSPPPLPPNLLNFRRAWILMCPWQKNNVRIVWSSRPGKRFEIWLGKKNRSPFEGKNICASIQTFETNIRRS